MQALAEIGPHDFEAETAVLATCLRGDASTYFRTTSTGLRADDFMRQSHAAIFAAIAGLAQDAIAPDVVSVADALAKTPAPEGHSGRSMLEACGGRERLEDLAADDARTENVQHYAGIVREASLSRGLLTVLNETKQAAADGTTFDSALDHFETTVEDLRSRANVRKSIRNGVDLTAAFNRKRLNPPDASEIGVVAPYGLPDLRKGSLEVWAGYTGDGKTVGGTDALGVACAAGARVGYASLEMTGDEIVERLVAKYGVPYDQTQSGRIEPQYLGAVEKAETAIAAWNFDVMDDEETNPAKLRRWAVAGKYDLVIIDHLHRIEFEDRFAIEKTVRAIRNMAKRLEIPVLMLAQLSRAGDKKNPFPRPTLASLRETAVIEHEAARVGFFYRLREEGENGGWDRSDSTEFFYAKNRYGSEQVGYRRLTFRGANQRFVHN